MKTDHGSLIREMVIEKLLSSFEKIAEKGDAKGLIALTKLILKVSRQFDNELMELRPETGDKHTHGGNRR